MPIIQSFSKYKEDALQKMNLNDKMEMCATAAHCVASKVKNKIKVADKINVKLIDENGLVTTEGMVIEPHMISVHPDYIGGDRTDTGVDIAMFYFPYAFRRKCTFPFSIGYLKEFYDD